MTTRQDIFTEIETERAYQDGKWGFVFDDQNTLNDWATYIMIYLARAAEIAKKDDKAYQRKALVKVASLAVAALETFDRNDGMAPRHYEVTTNA